MTDFISQSINQVQELYTTHPYPRYPLLAIPRWTAGYTSSLPWIQSFYGTPCDNRQLFLAAGCGEILPSVLSPWLARGTTCIGLDLSLTSLTRALWRSWLTKPVSQLLRILRSPQTQKNLFKIFTPEECLSALSPRRGSMILAHGDLINFLRRSPLGIFDHIDAYGVLHHLPSPRTGLELIGKALKPGGTLRLMVYNSRARTWIWEIQRLLALLKIDFRLPQDLQLARELIIGLAAANPRLNQALSQMGAQTLHNDARFADTFLHPREARIDAGTWFRWFEESGLSVLGLFDRYGELDHLPNPLWTPPPQEVLCQEIDRPGSLAFEGNLEFYLMKSIQKPSLNKNPIPSLSIFHRFRLLVQGPPAFWFSYPETCDLKAPDKLKLWSHFVSQWAPYPHSPKRTLPPWPLPVFKRLARLGAINPNFITQDQFNALNAPLADPGSTARQEASSAPALSDPKIPSPIEDIIRARCARIVSQRSSQSGLEKVPDIVQLRTLRILTMGPHL